MTVIASAAEGAAPTGAISPTTTSLPAPGEQPILCYLVSGCDFGVAHGAQRSYCPAIAGQSGAATPASTAVGGTTGVAAPGQQIPAAAPGPSVGPGGAVVPPAAGVPPVSEVGAADLVE